ncbi:MAG: MFS transporter [Tepidimonas sp.]|uniref:MFS transporter n=1 Tax=Tepidimonas sp. TaxID=2002775 RepID=UPI00259F6774|nr:MFS transporter [Tepidimonas sp.]MDM7457415.1 MFS transporter [Tepidimonas sp.]
MNPSSLSIGDGWRYGLLGLPLAFAALPLYVHLPHHYASLGVPLTTLGGVLLLARAFDALTDPWLGRWLDGVFQAGPSAVMRRAWLIALMLWLGLLGLLFPPAAAQGHLAAWALAGALVTTLAYSVLVIAHQSWGTRLGGDATRQARIAAWREGCTLAGVVVASMLPALAGWTATLTVLALVLLAALLALGRGPSPASLPLSSPSVTAHRSAKGADWRLPWQRSAFRRLMAVFVLNGLASAMPATLVLFFIADRLQASEWQGMFLAGYFGAAAAGMPAWLSAVRRIGLARAWLAAMGLSIAVFAWAALLGPGDAWAFAAVCVLSGLALGADLALPAALLAGVIADAGDRGRHDGAYFGWWNLAAKGNLALAAGLGLPALAWLGYTPGTRDPTGLQALSLAYAILPCVIKALAAWLLWRGWVRPPLSDVRPTSPGVAPPN